MKIFFKKVLLIISVFFVTGCSNPTQDVFPDKIELESVWQFLKIFSIHQQNIPEDPFVFDYPEQLMAAVGDTLKGYSFTRYATDKEMGISGSNSLNDTIADVKLDTLTDSTVMLSIVYEFKGGFTYKKFLEVIDGVKGYQNIIIDIRYNGGGIIDEVDSIIEAFLPSDIEYIESRERMYHPKTGTAETIEWRALKTIRPSFDILKDKKVAVLMNGGTASASEMLAAALQEGVGAVLVGERSFGKAIGQVVLVRRNNPGLKITCMQLRSISQGDYQGIGLKPDKVSFEEKVTCDMSTDTDRHYLLCAVRALEPAVKVSDIQFPDVLAPVNTRASEYVDKYVYEE